MVEESFKEFLVNIMVLAAMSTPVVIFITFCIMVGKLISNSRNKDREFKEWQKAREKEYQDLLTDFVNKDPEKDSY